MPSSQLINFLYCPVCKGKLKITPAATKQRELLCNFDRLAFPIINGIPVMLIEHARKLSTSELLLPND